MFSSTTDFQINGGNFTEVAGDSTATSIAQIVHGGTATSAGRDTNLVINYNYLTQQKEKEKRSGLSFSSKVSLWWASRLPPAVSWADAALQPTPPEGLKYFNLTDPEKLDHNMDQYPILKYGGCKYWALSYTDNRYAFAILVFDSNRKMVKRFDKSGARYIYQILLERDIVKFVGQGSRAVTFRLEDLAIKA